MANEKFDNIVSSYALNDSYVSSRYRKLNRVVDDSNDEYIEGYEPMTFPKSPDDRYHLVTPKEEDRLDLISHQYYGNPLLYWVIAEASGINDPFIVPAGSTLRIPSKQSLYAYKGVLV